MFQTRSHLNTVFSKHAMTRVLFICCHDSFLHHADIRIDVLLRMSAVLRNHFDDSASDDDTVRNFCNVGCLIGRVDAEAYGYRNIGYFVGLRRSWNRGLS